MKAEAKCEREREIELNGDQAERADEGKKHSRRGTGVNLWIPSRDIAWPAE